MFDVVLICVKDDEALEKSEALELYILIQSNTADTQLLYCFVVDAVLVETIQSIWRRSFTYQDNEGLDQGE